MAEYSFKSGIDSSEYLSFLRTVPAYCFTQLPEWADVKDNWGNDICGLYKDGKLIAGAMLLIRHLVHFLYYLKLEYFLQNIYSSFQLFY